MKKIWSLLTGILLIIGVAVSPVYAAYNFYGATALTGGASGSLDGIDGADLATGDAAYVVTSSDYYVYYLNATSAAAESSPDIISPDDNAGDKRWILIYHGDVATAEIADLAVTDSNFIVGNGTTWVAESGDVARVSMGVGSTDSPTFVTTKLSGLTDTYLPYHVADGTGLANSPLSTDGTDVVAAHNFYAETYGSDKSVTDAELKYINTLSSNAQDQLDARCLESVFGTAIGTGLLLDGTTLKTQVGLQSIAGLTETNGGIPYGTADNTYAWLAAGAEGALLMGNGAGAPSWLAAGTSGYVLVAAGAADPAWTQYLAVSSGGTGAGTAQNAINALTAVSGATNEHVLTKDTATGNAIFKVATGGAPSDATYITQTANGTLSAEQALSALATGIVKNTTTTGVLSIAADGTDYLAPTRIDDTKGNGDTGYVWSADKVFDQLALKAPLASPEFTGSPTIGTSIDPDAADGATIGSATKEWSDAYFAGGAVLYFENDQSSTVTSSAAGLTFNKFPMTPSAAPDADYEVANKKYVDDNSINNVVEDTTPQLGGTLDANEQSIQHEWGTLTSNATASGDIISATAGENVVFGSVCYFKSDGKFWKTDADAEATSKGMIAMAIATIAGNATGLFLKKGFARDDTWNWTVAAELWLDTATAGGLTETKPSGSADIVRLIGYAKAADYIEFDPSKVYLEID